jgi:hypothetical protein
MSAAELVTAGIEANPAALERVMRAAASVGMFSEEASGRFGLTPLSAVLTSDSPASIKLLVEELGGTWLKLWTVLGDTIRTGEPQAHQVVGMPWWDYLNANPKELERFGETMKTSSLNSMKGVLEHCDFSGVRKVVDVGGGYGHLVVALLETYPALRGVLLDVPALIPAAQKNYPVSDPDIASRLEYVGGDMFRSVPRADAYVLKHIIHDWDDEHCVRLLRNCHESMDGNGRLICVDAVLPPMGDTGAVPAKFLDIAMMVGIRGKERTRQQWEDLYLAGGFRVVRVVPPLQDDFGASIVEGVKDC